MVPGFYETAQHNVFKVFLKSHSHFFALRFSRKLYFKFIDEYVLQFAILHSKLISTVQYRPSENKIVFGLKVPSSDGLGLILSLK